MDRNALSVLLGQNGERVIALSGSSRRLRPLAPGRSMAGARFSGGYTWPGWRWYQRKAAGYRAYFQKILSLIYRLFDLMW